ncbi:protein FAM83E [Thalassophryne amazonica]|uniref:protein FAM83E n=1 Tax=Thalassophryne amazonica TaxID=390379 RepID=UPI00147242E6|nr:protein FAM83E [Thalassophryne amazonica]
MSNSQVQSLDEDVVFLPVTESSAEFFHCEKERQAVERLLCGGPEAFYSFISAEGSGCFLAPEEVSQIITWAQEYCFNSLQAQKEEDGDDGTTEMYFSSTYFPFCSDTPVPCLQLGWPEHNSWVQKEHVSVYTSPPTEGQPPVREVIRHHLQKATRVIAIVTDRLTDGAVIGDLHDAASRGVPVYIILNQRSIQENFALTRLRHPNMQVRTLGGKTFCSRTGSVVVGEMKDKFLLVDLETVIHGSYSLTWTDAHLHRQLITVLQGPVVELFDKEFRILYAASLPIPDMWRAAFLHTDVINRLKDFSDRRFPRNLPMEPEITAPPSPPADFTLDWEAMGVVQRDSILPETLADLHEDPVPKKTMLQNNVQLDPKAPTMDVFLKIEPTTRLANGE